MRILFYSSFSFIANCLYLESLISVFRITECLGYGQFGKVHQGVWKDPNKATLDVAVKTLGSGASVENRIKLLQEAAIMGQFIHPNTIQLLGVVISEDLVSE